MAQAPPATNNPRVEGETAGFDASSWIWDQGVLIACASQLGATFAGAAGQFILVEAEDSPSVPAAAAKERLMP